MVNKLDWPNIVCELESYGVLNISDVEPQLSKAKKVIIYEIRILMDLFSSFSWQ